MSILILVFIRIKIVTMKKIKYLVLEGDYITSPYISSIFGKLFQFIS